MAAITYLKAEDLKFDWQNPRLVQYSIKQNTKEDIILNILWDEMAVNEIVMSILAHGFFENEAMYAVEENGELVVVEGNRRLAAVKAILNPSLIKTSGMNKYASQITSELKEQLSSRLPVIKLNNREEAWRYIGFKHVNGAAKWDSYAKAQYIASVHHDFGISLEDIAAQIGDENRTVIKLYQGLMLLKQADTQTDFKIDDIYGNKLYFSHLYTAMAYEGYQKYIGIDLTQKETNLVPQNKLKQLNEVMLWIYGSKSRDVNPIVKTQNPDVKYLNEVLKKPEAIEALKASGNLAIALDISYDGGEVLAKSLVEAKVALEKASSKLSYYNGDQDILKQSMDIADSADIIFKALKTKYKEILGEDTSKRTLE